MAPVTSGGTSATGLGTAASAGVLRFLLFLFVLAAVVLVVMATVARPVLRAVVVPWAWSNPGVMDIGFVSDLVREDLGGALSAPASDDSTEVEFMVEPGDTPALLAPKLAEAGIIANERAFLYEARVEGLTPKLNAGRFALALNLTPQQVVNGLVNNRIETRTVQLPLREGLRLEQIVAKLQTIPGTDVDPKDFYDLATKPPDVAARRLPVAAGRDCPSRGRVARGLPVPGHVHDPRRATRTRPPPRTSSG